MKKHKNRVRAIYILVCLVIAASAASCYGKPQNTDSEMPNVTIENTPAPTYDAPPDTQTPTAEPPPTTPLPYAPDTQLVPYDGIVEHIFFHEIIAYPELAFDGETTQKGYDENMVTVSEFHKILDSIYSNDFILVDMNDVWSEYTDDSGVQRMQRNTLMLPEGKKPLIISFDDISFYEYMRNDGFMHRLIIGPDGDIWAAGADPDGNEVVSQDLAAIPILDKFVREHPDFSSGGAKGCIALTGYEGILGYRTQYDRNNDTEESRLNRLHEIARVMPVIDRLKETGWYFASHTYGHIDLSISKLDRVIADATRWMDEVGSLLGEVKILIYAHGARLDGSDVYNTGPAFQYYHDLGFRLFASVGSESFSRIKPDISAVVCDRMHVDGVSLRGQRNQYLKFYDAAEVFDPLRPPEYSKSW